MRGMNQALLGILAAIFSAAIVLGSLLLSLVEGGQAVAALPASHATPTPPLMTLPPGAPTYTPSATPSVTPTPTAAPPANCTAVPAGWQAVMILPDDSLSTIAARYGTTEQALRQGNCLPTTTDQLLSGKEIFVPVPPASPTPPPPTPTLRPTRTAVACGAPPGWVQYRVRPGDTLFGLGIRLGVPQGAIRSANCSLQGRTGLIAGELLWVPFIPLAPTLPPTWTRTSPPPTFTATPLPPTLAPTRTSPPPTRTSPPSTNTPPPTDTPLPATDTALPPTATPPPTNTPLPPTDTPLPTDTPVPPTNTPKPPTDTPVPPTNTSQPASTAPPVIPSDTPLPTGNGLTYPELPPGVQLQSIASSRPAAPVANRPSRIAFLVIDYSAFI